MLPASLDALQALRETQSLFFVAVFLTQIFRLGIRRENLLLRRHRQFHFSRGPSLGAFRAEERRARIWIGNQRRDNHFHSARRVALYTFKRHIQRFIRAQYAEVGGYFVSANWIKLHRRKVQRILCRGRRYFSAIGNRYRASPTIPKKRQAKNNRAPTNRTAIWKSDPLGFRVSANPVEFFWTLHPLTLCVIVAEKLQ